MNETNRTYPNLVAKIQAYMANKNPKLKLLFHYFENQDRIKNMLKFMAIVYISKKIIEQLHNCIGYSLTQRFILHWPYQVQYKQIDR